MSHGDVELAAPQIVEGQRRLDLVDGDFDVWIGLRKPHQNARQESPRCALEDAETHAAAVIAEERGEVVGRSVEELPNLSGAPAQLLAGVREADNTAVALDERGAALTLQRRDLLGDRRGRERERARSAGEAAVSNDRVQHEQAAWIERRQLI